jgi:hypothetical protein
VHAFSAICLPPGISSAFASLRLALGNALYLRRKLCRRRHSHAQNGDASLPAFQLAIAANYAECILLAANQPLEDDEAFLGCETLKRVASDTGVDPIN